jgi:ADP-ribose pyrophosphatase
VVQLEVDRVRLPGGGETEREVVRHAGASVMLPLLDDGRAVLVRQFRYPIGRVLLELPAGKLEPGEEPLACAERELVEEIGWQARTWRRLGSFYTTPGFSDEVLHAFLATDLERPARPAEPDPDEIFEIVPMSAGQIRQAIASGELCDAKSLVALQLARVQGLLDGYLR